MRHDVTDVHFAHVGKLALVNRCDWITNPNKLDTNAIIYSHVSAHISKNRTSANNEMESIAKTRQIRRPRKKNV